LSATAPISKKIRWLEFQLRRRVKDLFAGGYQSAFKGQGMVFTDSRRYIPGDDVRAINWSLTAKKGETYIKIFEEEKGATFMLVMDVSGSFDFGTRGFKGEVACELASLIALSAQRNRDRTGLLLFSDRVEHYVPPGYGMAHTSRIVKDLYSFQRKSSRTDIVPSLDFLNGVLKKHCHIFLLSDFCMSSSFVKPLRILSRRHDVSVAIICDPFEADIPPLGLMEMEDAETGQRMIVDTSSSGFSQKYRAVMQQQQQEVDQQLVRSEVNFFHVHTNQDVFKQLLLFIKKRRMK